MIAMQALKVTLEAILLRLMNLMHKTSRYNENEESESILKEMLQIYTMMVELRK